MNDNKMTISFLAGVKYRNKIYFSAVNSNGLFSFDIETEKITFLKMFECENIRHLLHVRAYLNGNEMWLIPLKAHHVACVNLETFNISYFSINCDETSLGAYYDAVRDGNKLYLVPYYTDNIVKVDMDEHTCEEIFKADYLKNFWACGAYIKNGILSIVKHDGDIGLKIQLNDGSLMYENCTLGVVKFNYSAKLGENYWLMSFDSREIKKCSISENADLNDYDQIDDMNLPLYRGVSFGNETIFFPCGDSRVFLIYDNENGKASARRGETIDNLSSDLWFEINTIDCDEGVWVSSINGVVVDCSNSERFKEFRMMIDEDQANAFFECALKYDQFDELFSGNVVRENTTLLNLDRYINYIARRN